MSPRGGRGGGATVVSVGSDGYNDDGVDDSVWTEPMDLVGSGFTNPYAVVYIVFLCLSFLVSFAVTIGTLWIKHRRTPSRGMFRFYSWGILLFAWLWYLILSVMDEILQEVGVSVDRIYIIVWILELFLDFVAELAILGIIYAIIATRIKHAWEGSSAGLHLAVRWIHAVVVVILTVLAIVALGFYIAYLVAAEGDGGTGLTAYQTYNKLVTAWQILYWISALGIMMWAIVSLIRPLNTYSSRRIDVYFIALVAVPQFIRTLYDMVVAIKYTLPSPSGPLMPHWLQAVYVIFDITLHTLVFVGILVLGLSKRWSWPGGVAPAEPVRINWAQLQKPTFPPPAPNPAWAQSAPSAPSAPSGPSAPSAPSAPSISSNVPTHSSAGPTSHSSAGGAGLPTAPAGTQWVLQPVEEPAAQLHGDAAPPAELHHYPDEPPAELQGYSYGESPPHSQYAPTATMTTNTTGLS